MMRRQTWTLKRARPVGVSRGDRRYLSPVPVVFCSVTPFSGGVYGIEVLCLDMGDDARW